MLIASSVPRLYAGSVTYCYSGNPFAFVFASPFTTEDRITGCFTAPAIPDGATFLAVDPSSYSFTDGVDILADANSFPNVFNFSTDPITGAITNWQIQLWTPGGTANEFPEFDSIKNGGASSDLVYAANGSGGAVVAFDPGTWASSPEPSAFFLLPLGLAALAGVRLLRSNFWTQRL